MSSPVITYKLNWGKGKSSYNCGFLAHFLRYFHKVPAEPPHLELKASYGLAEPVSFELPPLSEQCSAEVYATFDLTKGAKNDKVLQPVLDEDDVVFILCVVYVDMT